MTTQLIGIKSLLNRQKLRIFHPNISIISNIYGNMFQKSSFDKHKNFIGFRIC